MTDQKRNPTAAPPDAQINKEDGIKYWNGVESDVNGMLGGIPSVDGFSQISKIDLQGSRTFLARLGIGSKRGRHDVSTALEGGAGIGRITNGLLVNVAASVDVIEPVAKFTDTLQDTPGVRNIFTMGLEEWVPGDGVQYDLIWVQWCVGHLTDDQLVQFLQRCKATLTPEKGVIVVKENMSTKGMDEFDEDDSSVTREDRKFRQIFEKAGLRIVRTDLQHGIPENLPTRLLPVRMYALKP